MTASENLITPAEKIPNAQLVTLNSQNADVEKPAEILIFDNFLFRNNTVEKKGDTLQGFSTASNFILMQFCIAGKIVCKHKHHRKGFSFKSLDYNILFIPKGEFNFSYSQGCNYIYLCINETLFLKYLPNGYIDVKYSHPDRFSPLFAQNLNIGPKLKSVLSDMATCEFEGHLKQLYLKAKLIELLTLQLAQYDEEKAISQVLKPVEAQKMMTVKALIESNLSQAYTLAALARAAGTNEQYLKKHFKLLFGNTVFGYILSCKMQKARDLLLSGNYRITEVAELVGYKHATHFTSAFKKFFGYLPQTLKMSWLVGFLLTS